MRFKRVRVAGLSHLVPPHQVSSASVEDKLAPLYERIGLHPGRLELMTGIKTRGFWAPGDTPSRVAAEAGRQALADAGIDPGHVGMLCHASVCRDFLEPATASVVHHDLGLGADCHVFDLSNACLGVANSLLIAGQMIDSGAISAALVVSGEDARPLFEHTIAALVPDTQLTRKTIKSAMASLTIGSAAAAVLLCDEQLSPDAPRLLGGVVRAATSHNGLCRGYAVADGLEMHTDSEALLEAGLGAAKPAFASLLETLDWSPDAIDFSVSHQVGRTHAQRMYETLGLPLERTMLTYETLGNVGSAALPATLSMARDAGRLEGGDRVAILGIGSGVNVAMLGISW